ncbi:MAG: class I SAM-dependent methyltransferase [Leptospiraceae bacterium]|nr:class I SAM-dependent methyltransferase [Leptospiraceae bacterium]MCP5492951.1 class I SAM-dependent methyltransferase [Leptospiraceae bacterium]
MFENRFDKIASDWDDNPIRQAIAAHSVQNIKDRVLLSKNMKVLDYGCGTGLILLGIYPYIGSIDGMDNSEGMVNVLKEKLTKANIQNVNAQTHNINEEPLPEKQYDMVVSGMMLHHIKDPFVFFQKTYFSLKENGYLCLSDLDTEDGTFHPATTTDYYHRGFDRGYIQDSMQKAGYKEITIETSYTVKKKEKEYPIFLAIGKK